MRRPETDNWWLAANGSRCVYFARDRVRLEVRLANVDAPLRAGHPLPPRKIPGAHFC
jgi:hypothetical protein